MEGRMVRVGVREFREDLADYLASSTPVAITRHGQTVGYYIPARGSEGRNEEIQDLTHAVARLEQLLQEYGLTEDEVVREFRALRASQSKDTHS